MAKSQEDGPLLTWYQTELDEEPFMEATQQPQSERDTLFLSLFITCNAI